MCAHVLQVSCLGPGLSTVYDAKGLFSLSPTERLIIHDRPRRHHHRHYWLNFVSLLSISGSSIIVLLHSAMIIRLIGPWHPCRSRTPEQSEQHPDTLARGSRQQGGRAMGHQQALSFRTKPKLRTAAMPVVRYTAVCDPSSVQCQPQRSLPSASNNKCGSGPCRT